MGRSTLLKRIGRWSIELTPKVIMAEKDKLLMLPLNTRVMIPHLADVNLDQILEAAEVVKSRKLVPVPHFAVRRLIAFGEIDQFISKLQIEVGVSEVMLVSGSLDARQSARFKDATSFLAENILQTRGIQHLYMAAFPQNRPGRKYIEEMRALQDKITTAQMSGLELALITQFCCNTNALVSWLKSTLSMSLLNGVRIHVGIPGPISPERLQRTAINLRVDPHPIDFSTKEITPDSQIQAILDQNIDVSFHFYPFTGLQPTLDWLQIGTVPTQ